MNEAQEFSTNERPLTSPPREEWKSELFNSEKFYESGVAILGHLRESIKSGDYAILLGDDASGRLHSRLLGDVIKEVYAQNGHPAPAIRFVAGSGADGTLFEEKNQALKEYASKLKEELSSRNSPGGKVLIVSDIISTGNSLNPLARALRDQGIPFDVVAFSAPDDIQLQILEERWGTRIVRGVGAGGVYGDHGLMGVEKNPAELHARALKGFQPRVRASRSDIGVVAQKLLHWWSESDASAEMH